MEAKWLALALALALMVSTLPLSPLANAIVVPPWSSTIPYPSTVDYHSCVASSGYIYCVGGSDGFGGTYNTVYYAALTSAGVGAWASTTNYPIGTFGLSCVTLSGFIYCIGGSYNSGGSDYYALLSSSGVGAWTSTTSYPTSIYQPSCVASSGFIYCIGGSTPGGPSSSVYFATLSSSGIGAWTSTTSYPFKIGGESCVSHSDFVYCMGGQPDSGSPYSTSAVYFASLFPTGVGAWTSTSSYPVSPNNPSCVVSGPAIYCIGGFDTPSSSVSGVYSAVASDSGVGTWTSNTGYPISDGALSCVASGGIYCVGGNSGSGTNFNNVYFVYFAGCDTNGDGNGNDPCNQSG